MSNFQRLSWMRYIEFVESVKQNQKDKALYVFYRPSNRALRFFDRFLFPCGSVLALLGLVAMGFSP